MRKFILAAAAIGSLYGAGTQAASASCLTESIDTNNNRVTVADLGCEGIETGDKGFSSPGGPYPKSAGRLAAEANVKTQLEKMAKTDSPAPDRPFISWLIEAMFAGFKAQATEQAGKGSVAPPVAARPWAKPEIDAAPRKVEDVLCILEVKGDGAVKDVAIVVAANRKLKGTGSARILLSGQNKISSENDFSVNLKAGGSQSFPLITTNSLNASVLSVTFKLKGLEVPCD